jgi:hypothetical protein
MSVLLGLDCSFCDNDFLYLCVESGGLSLAKAGQLPAVLAKEKQSLKDEERKLHHDRMMRDKQFKQYYQVHYMCFASKIK